jgi:hypothetical protein
MSFGFQRAKREGIHLIAGLAGATGSGKTMSALRLATGMAGGEPFAYIDTEAGRALHYADDFRFDHGTLDPPFTPARYIEAIKAADEAGYPVIVVDSGSHEHAGEGGLLDAHEEVLSRMAGTDWKKREAMTFAAWVEPKRQHQLFVNRLLQLKAHLIICLRAQEKIELAKNDKGKLEVRPKRSLVGLDGWMPICERNLPFELTLSLLFTPDEPGVPKPIKLPEALRLLLPLDVPVNEEAGAKLAEWAKGDEKENPDIAETRSELLDLSDQLGVREQVTAGIQKNRQRNDDAQHLAWLTQKRDDAKDAVESMDLPELDLKPEGDE